MNSHTLLAVTFSPLLLLAACGASNQARTAHLLDHRLQSRLAPDIAAHKVAVEPVTDGVRVTFLDGFVFPAAVDSLDNQSGDPRANLIEGMLDPDLMGVQVADTSALPDDQRQDRVRRVVQYFVANGLGPTLRPADPQPPGTTGLTVTINVHCPARPGIGYGSGRRKPGCF